MIYFGKTDIGKKRKGNQDNFGTYKIAENAVLCVVCDGMGGACGGEEASRLALEAFSADLEDTCRAHISDGVLDAGELDIKLILENAVVAANKKVYETAEGDQSLRGMGTTLVAFFSVDNRYYSVNVGDSRMYMICGKEIKQITHDHSYVQYLVDIGKLTPKEAKESTNRNIITRAIGTAEDIEADVCNIELPENTEDIYILLCSDGLTNMVSDEKIAAIAKEELTVEEKVAKLIAQANKNGGSDNITVVLIKMQSEAM